MGEVHNRAHRIDRAERIRHVRQRDDASAVGEQGRERVDVQLAGAGDGCGDQPRAVLLAHQLPRHDVGVVLHPGDEHFVTVPMRARPYAAATRLIASVVPRTNTISRLDAAFRKRATVSRAALVLGGGALAQPVDAAMHVGVLARVVAYQPIDDRLRLVRGRRVVEIDERTIARRTGEDREIAPHGRDVERYGTRRRYSVAAAGGAGGGSAGFEQALAPIGSAR
jgi:hypothetical protein